MENKTQIKKEFDTVSFFHNIKEQIANELQGKSFDEQKALLKKIQSGDITLKTPNEA
jgi:poly-gamma-glutamate capsule biosynthesis protein CapA/YwtB (metallophosphatase superfamily)